MCVTNRDQRIENYYQQSAWDLAERIVDLEDNLTELKRVWGERVKKADELDPSRLESALRMYVANLDYDIHKGIQDPEDGGPDRYPDEAGYFIHCWETAGEG